MPFLNDTHISVYIKWNVNPIDIPQFQSWHQNIALLVLVMSWIQRMWHHWRGQKWSDKEKGQKRQCRLTWVKMRLSTIYNVHYQGTQHRYMENNCSTVAIINFKVRGLHKETCRPDNPDDKTTHWWPWRPFQCHKNIYVGQITASLPLWYTKAIHHRNDYLFNLRIQTYSIEKNNKWHELGELYCEAM